MEANRLDELRTSALKTPIFGMGASTVLELLDHIDQQQAEIERLNRAYEVLERQLKVISPAAHKVAVERAQSIKEGKDGEQG